MIFEGKEDFLKDIGAGPSRPLYLYERSPEEKSANAAHIREDTMKMKCMRWSQGCAAGFILAIIIAVIIYFIWLA